MLPNLIGEPIIVPESVLQAWNLDAVASRTHAGNLLPSHVAWAAVHSAVEDVVRVLTAEVAVGYRARPVEIVLVPKLDRTTRPAADMAVEDQLLYTALIEVLQGSVPEGFVSYTGLQQTYRDFEQFPLTVESARYVLEADAAGFYQYVDHEKLAYELLGLTGRSDAVEPLVRLLEGWQGDRRGLPQGPPASYVLADIYISPVVRALERAGFSFSRYSDDFRITGETWGEVKRAQELLERTFYRLGLVVASKKLRTFKIDTYRRRIQRVDDGRLNNPVIRETLDELEAEDYVPAVGTRRAVTAEQMIRAKAVFTIEIAAEQVDVLSTRLIRNALPVLGSVGDVAPLEHLRTLLTKYPHLTSNVGAYLRLLTGTDAEPAAVASASDWLASRTYRYGWQEGWILHALAHAREPVAAVVPQAQRALGASDLPWFARAQAAIALAVHGGFPSQRDFVAIFERAPAATRADLIVAVRIARPSWEAGFLRGGVDRPLAAAITTLGVDGFRDWI